jgi:hypothetical protein
MTATDTTAPGMRPDKSLPFLADTATDLLALAEDAALPLPVSLRISQVCQDVSLGFAKGHDSLAALARWAECFGVTVTGDPYTGDDGEQSIYCQVEFTYGGMRVEAFAFIPAGEASTT